MGISVVIAFVGIASGLYVSPSTAVAVETAPDGKSGTVSGLFNCIKYGFNITLTTILTTVVTHREISCIEKLTPTLGEAAQRAGVERAFSEGFIAMTCVIMLGFVAAYLIAKKQKEIALHKGDPKS